MDCSGPTYLDLFAGAGGLSEGFERAGFHGVAHVEMDAAACFTLRTRQAFRWLVENGREDFYNCYLRGEVSREELYRSLPDGLLDQVLNYEIGLSNIQEIFGKIDTLRAGRAIDLIIGGPPCQAYSLVGRSRDSNNMVNDRRNYLYRMYARFLGKYRPKYFVFENVTGLLSAKNENGTPYLKVMTRAFRRQGYSTEYRILDAKDFGVPQSRQRIVLIGKLLAPGQRMAHGFYPAFEMAGEPSCTINELFEDLPRLRAGEGDYYAKPTLCRGSDYLYEASIKSRPDSWVTLHIARPHTPNDLEIYREAVRLWNDGERRLVYDELPNELITHRNTDSFLDRYKVVEGGRRFSHTVVAHISKDGHYYIHPDIEQNRSLTPREAARLQTFPDDYFFESKDGDPQRTPAFRQIGNAVPVKLAESIASAMRSLYD